MTMFVCVGLKGKPLGIKKVFGAGFILDDVSNTPIGRATLANSKGEALLVHVNRGSWNLENRNQKQQDVHQLFANAVDTLCRLSGSVSITTHWFHGMIAEEELPFVEKVLLKSQEFRDMLPEVREDVRYVVLNN